MPRSRRLPLFLAVVAGVMVPGGPASHAAPAKKPAPQTVPGELLVGFQSDVTPGEQQKILKAAGLAAKKRCKQIHGSLPHTPSADVSTASAKLQHHPRVRSPTPTDAITAHAPPNPP